MTKQNSDPAEWNGDTMTAETTCTHCTDALASFCTEVRGQGHPFTLVLGPIRTGVLEAHPALRAVAEDRRARVQTVLHQCGGALFDVTAYFSLSDDCFANSVHLNARGMYAVTTQLERFRRHESMAQAEKIPLSCSASPAGVGTDLVESGRGADSLAAGTAGLSR